MAEGEQESGISNPYSGDRDRLGGVRFPALCEGCRREKSGKRLPMSEFSYSMNHIIYYHTVLHRMKKARVMHYLIKYLLLLCVQISFLSIGIGHPISISLLATR